MFYERSIPIPGRSRFRVESGYFLEMMRIDI